ncbi:Dynamin central region-domain-containing protein [Mycena belliarum]|uniref:Vacuolar protein sorting-associated protein 1 n=1 Tax=Mycena belliarum TaxID=1033014 RepID=A0AAD6UA87_9AGAR|nr:Dynamin central region-domain-containing protein [Mycena belliae]
MATGPSGLGVEIVSTINKLQDVFTTVGSSAAQIDLPQICVLGSQSSGKSSVLENIVGRDFLPRGSGIVTRRPLVLQLINRAASAPAPAVNGVTPAPQMNGAEKGNDKHANQDEWGEFLHLPGEKFYDFNKIREEIVRDTEAKTGRNAGISPQPINLRIFSPNVLTLTLVDLPGLTKVPVGDQPRDIEKQIRDMLMKYIAKPACIILAVTGANQDLANSEGLKMAREVDPEGTRTIGVLTKVDLMDAGTDVVDILAGRIIPMRLGYVPVVNRGQRDIDSNRPISYALEKEREFFENHPSYRGKAQYCGTPFLAHKLNTILKLHIRNTLPDIKARITQQLQKFTAELATLGGPLGDGNSANVVLSVITEFTSEFQTVIDGNTNDLSLNELSGGARISFVFHELFNNGIKNIDPFDQRKDDDIRVLLYNSSGSTPGLFVGTAAFEVIVKQQIMRLEDPSLRCCQLVYDELIRILGQLLTKIQAFRRYPALRERFNSVVVNFFKNSMGPTTKLVSDMVAMQACYVNTTHPDFISGHKAMAIVNDRMNANKPPPPAADPKTGKLGPGQINNNRDLDVEPKKEEASFFGSFFAPKPKGTTKKNGVPASTMEAPPAVIRPQAALNERETMETEVIKLLIHSYFNIVKREMIDMVPKAISLTLVTHSTKNLQRELLQELYKPEVLDDLLKESEFIVNRRKEVTSMVAALNKAEEIVAGV